MVALLEKETIITVLSSQDCVMIEAVKIRVLFQLHVHVKWKFFKIILYFCHVYEHFIRLIRR